MLQDYRKWNVPHLIGIDIRQNFIRLIGLVYYNNTYQITNCINLTLPFPPQNEQVTITTLKAMLQQSVPQIRNVAIALPYNIALRQEYLLDHALTPTNLHKFIEYKISTESAVSEEQFSFTYQIFPPSSKQTGSTVQIIAVPKRHILRWVKSFHTTQCHLQAIDLDIYALARVLRWQLYQQKISGIAVLINIDNAHLLILALAHTQLVYHHEEFLLTTKRTSITYILETITIKLQFLLTTLKLNCKTLIIGGNIVTLPGLIDLLRDKLKITVIYANPFIGMKFAASLRSHHTAHSAPLMLLSCGLALRVIPTREHTKIFN